MKKYLFFLCIGASFLFSCSSDKDEDNLKDESGSIVGTWSFTELNTDDADSSQIALSEDIIGVLIAQNCEILVFDFMDDNTVTAVSRDFTETGRDINLGGTGLLIECPSNSLTKSSIWSLEGNQLTFLNEDQTEETVTIELDGNTLIIPAEIINEENLGGAKAIFTRR